MFYILVNLNTSALMFHCKNINDMPMLYIRLIPITMHRCLITKTFIFHYKNIDKTSMQKNSGHYLLAQENTYIFLKSNHAFSSRFLILFEKEVPKYHTAVIANAKDIFQNLGKSKKKLEFHFP